MRDVAYFHKKLHLRCLTLTQDVNWAYITCREKVCPGGEVVTKGWSEKNVTFKIFPEILGSICDGVLEPAMVPTTLLKKDYMAGIFLEFCEIYNSVNKLTCNCESLLLQLLWILFTLERYFHENNRNSMKKQSSGGVL